jgi:hypothetical protein
LGGGYPCGGTIGQFDPCPKLSLDVVVLLDVLLDILDHIIENLAAKLAYSSAF